MIKHFNPVKFLAFQKKAIDKNNRGGEFQTEILNKALLSDGSDFVVWLESCIAENKGEGGAIIGDKEPGYPPQPEKYTAQDFKQPPTIVADSMWESWKEMELGVACSSAVWGYIVSRLIRDGKIEPYFLMVGKNGGQTDGRKEIETALNAVGESRQKEIDGCVRAFLRRLSGIYERGARSVYQNCPPACVWWQYHIAREVAPNTDKNITDVIKLLKTPHIWELLTDKMASRLTVIGDKNIRDGLTSFLMTPPENGKIFVQKKPALNALITRIGIMSAWRALGFFPPDKVREIIIADIMPGTQETETSDV